MTQFISYKKEINLGQFIIYINQLIGEGSFGKIYIGLNTHTYNKIAVKIETINNTEIQNNNNENNIYNNNIQDNNIKNNINDIQYNNNINKSTLKYESEVLKYLQGGEGIPKIYGFYTINEGDIKYNCMVMELLGKSIEDIMNISKIHLREILLLSGQMISRIEYLHNRNIIHRDIKPSNFLLGKCENKNLLYLCDFGLAKKYIENGEHIPYIEGKKLIGTVRFTSIYSHMGIELSRRDDLESFLYSVLYMIKGKLPWQGIKAKTKQEKQRIILEMKINTTISELCKGMDEGFSCLFQYVKCLKFTEKPDYSYMKSILIKIFEEHNFEYINGELFFNFNEHECNDNIKYLSKSV